MAAPPRLGGIEVDRAVWPEAPSAVDLRSMHVDWANRFTQAHFAQLTCAVCAQLHHAKDSHVYPAAMPAFHDLLIVPSDFLPFLRHNHPDEWDALFTFGALELDGLMIDPAGIVPASDDGVPKLRVCSTCSAALRAKRPKVPSCALVRGTWTGPTPPELACLTVAERLAISLDRYSRRAFYFLKSPLGAGADPLSRQYVAIADALTLAGEARRGTGCPGRSSRIASSTRCSRCRSRRRCSAPCCISRSAAHRLTTKPR